MADRSARTEMGGQRASFRTTHWSQILSVHTQDEVRQRTVLNELARDYWKPVYCYLRHKGYDNETAKDLVQGFFADVVFDRRLVQRAEPRKGRFRTLLLAALDRYVIDVHRAGAAKKRVPQAGLISLEAIRAANVPSAYAGATPDEAFNYAWASEILAGVLDATRQQCIEQGKVAHWELFFARIVRPILQRSEQPSLPELCRRHGIQDEATGSRMIFWAKGWFRSVMRQHLRELVGSDEEAEEEFSDLMKILSGKRARRA